MLAVVKLGRNIRNYRDKDRLEPQIDSQGSCDLCPPYSSKMAEENSGTIGNIEAADVGVIVAYFVIVMGFGIWVSDIMQAVYEYS